MTQITWRNVATTASPAGVGGLMSGAQDSMTRGFEALEKVFEQRKETEAANWDQGKENNLNTIMNAAMAYEDPDALAASMQAGKFQEMLEGYGAQVDQAKVRDFLDSRGGVLQERALANDEFFDKRLTRELQPQLAEVQQLAFSGNLDGAVQRAIDLGVPDAAKYVQGLQGTYSAGRSEKRADQQLVYEGQRTAAQVRDSATNAGRLDLSVREYEDGLARREAQRERLQSVLQSSDRIDAALLENMTTLDRTLEQAGFSRDGDNLVAGENADYEALARLKEDGALSMVGKPTEILQREIQRINNMGWDSLQERNEAVNAVITQNAERLGVSQGDLDWKAQEEAVLEQAFDIRNNVFNTPPPENPLGAMTEIITRHAEEGGYLESEGNRDKVRLAIQKAVEATTTGIVTRNDEGEAVRVRVPQEIIDAALTGTSDTWFEWDEKFGDILQDYMRKTGVLEQGVVFGEYEKAGSRLNTEFIRRVNRSPAAVGGRLESNIARQLEAWGSQ